MRDRKEADDKPARQRADRQGGAAVLICLKSRRNKGRKSRRIGDAKTAMTERRVTFLSWPGHRIVDSVVNCVMDADICSPPIRYLGRVAFAIATLFNFLTGNGHVCWPVPRVMRLRSQPPVSQEKNTPDFTRYALASLCLRVSPHPCGKLRGTGLLKSRTLY